MKNIKKFISSSKLFLFFYQIAKIIKKVKLLIFFIVLLFDIKFHQVDKKTNLISIEKINWKNIEQEFVKEFLLIVLL